MRKAITILASLMLCLTIQAQTNTDRIGLGTGLLYRNGLEATVQWEHEGRYHNAWELFATGYLQWRECESCHKVCRDSFWRDYDTWHVGMAWKPCLVRSLNRHGNLRLGASIGSNRSDVLAGLHAGYEHTYSLRHGWQLYWQAKVDMMLPQHDDLLRSGLAIGLRMPCNIR